SEITPEDEEAADAAGAEDVVITRGDDAVFTLTGRWIEALMGRVNLNDRESLMYFERSLVKSGIIDRLREAGCQEGDMVRIDDFEFDFVD
ncbi:MAG: Obg family GTPase CgtA, partial [Clostridia bacterium]|nr:Obg family GTPase CgtA [Clostridia bacterium]